MVMLPKYSQFSFNFFKEQKSSATFYSSRPVVVVVAELGKKKGKNRKLFFLTLVIKVLKARSAVTVDSC